MSLYAKINSENIVENVIVCDDSQISVLEGTYIKVTAETKDAQIGETYDLSVNKFIPAKPYNSWVLGSDYEWHSPAGDSPSDSVYEWDEESLSWIELEPGELKQNTHRWDVELQEWVPLS